MGLWLLLEIMEKNSNKGVTKPCIAAGWAINNKRGRKCIKTRLKDWKMVLLF